ncbi:EF-hand domain-containing protein [Actinomadura logoneensis]|uniref:EF-hand domain-containing protein n=1 Tax=Actinomadura logoneensis TaxID=2293572 RepID=A0A372JS75_9ACTN|nr:EF-hand domain-containing protein [Actinomadura logoneensis]RFU42624.1 EF-hand domain-containing protein [Actinomadura logoneensis]
MADEVSFTGSEASSDGNPGSAASPNATSLLQQAEATFKALDGDGDGFVTRDELRASYKSLGLDLPEAALDQLMSADTNGDGRVDLEEWLRSVEPAPQPDGQEPPFLD